MDKRRRKFSPALEPDARSDCEKLDFELPSRFVVFVETGEIPRPDVRALTKIKLAAHRLSYNQGLTLVVGKLGSAGGVEQGGDFVGQFARQVAQGTHPRRAPVAGQRVQRHAPASRLRQAGAARGQAGDDAGQHVA